MPILEIKIIQHRGKTGKGRLYKKQIAISKCDQCEKVWEARRFEKDNSFTFCSRKCVNIASKDGGKIDRAKRETCIERYGAENPLQSKEVWEKRTKTIVEKYGVKHIQHSDVWKVKRKEAIYQKYGKEHTQTDEFKQKRHKTFMKKYGVKSPMEHEEFLEKRKNTNIERYGGEPLSNPKICNKMFQTNLERYGYITSFGSNEIQKKSYKTRVGMTREEYLEQLPEYTAYKNRVWNVTNSQDLRIFGDKKRTINGYHLDHIYSISQGFKDDILPEIIGDVCNLRIILASENRKKSNKCNITKTELMEKYYESRK